MTEYRVGSVLRSTQGDDLGHVDALVVDPTNLTVTHLVVSHDKLSPRVLVPVRRVSEASPEAVTTDLGPGDLERAEPFDAPDYNDPDVGMAYGDMVLDPGSYFLEPFASPLDGWVLTSHERVPKGEITIRRGQDVYSSDQAHLGKVDEFLVDPEDDHITHVVVRQGSALRRQDVVVPVTAATTLEDDRVVLRLSRDEVESLDHIPVKRHAHQRDR